MIGEAQSHAIAARNPPAQRQGGCAIIQMALQRRGEVLHLRIYSKGMAVIDPNLSNSRVTSSVSLSKRTGTSNSKPARTMTPLATAVLNQDTADVEALTIRQTPTFFLNGKRLENFSMESLMEDVRVAVAGAI
jgi:hypothetical protein